MTDLNLSFDENVYDLNVILHPGHAGTEAMMADRIPERTQSHAHAVLRRSSKRLLLFIEGEIARCGGGSVSIHNDQFAVGPVKVVLPGLSELHALGLIDVTRFPSRHVCAMSERWRDIRTMRDAKIVSVVARVQPKPTVMVPSAAASASTAPPERRTTPRGMLVSLA